jgi:hypothetical protein
VAPAPSFLHRRRITPRSAGDAPRWVPRRAVARVLVAFSSGARVPRGLGEGSEGVKRSEGAGARDRPRASRGVTGDRSHLTRPYRGSGAIHVAHRWCRPGSALSLRAGPSPAVAQRRRACLRTCADRQRAHRPVPAVGRWGWACVRTSAGRQRAHRSAPAPADDARRAVAPAPSLLHRRRTTPRSAGDAPRWVPRRAEARVLVARSAGDAPRWTPRRAVAQVLVALSSDAVAGGAWLRAASE